MKQKDKVVVGPLEAVPLSVFVEDTDLVEVEVLRTGNLDSVLEIEKSMSMNKGDDGEKEELVADDIHYSTPNGKSHTVSSYSGPISPPAVGMVFDSWESVEKYFRSYGKQQGFGVNRGPSANRHKGGQRTLERRSMRWECEFFGAQDKRVRVNGKKVTLTPKKAKDGQYGVKIGERKSKKCDCPVHIYAGADSDARSWTIKRVVLEHEGHTPTPSKSRHVSSYRQEAITSAVKKKLFNDLEVGVKIPLIHRSMALERNGLQNMPFTERDLRNVAAKLKREIMEIEGGDANAMVNYLRRMAAENDKFYHAERVDANDALKDVMWVDARSRVAYEEFGDVVCFDTTYITNKFHLPFANFVGINHHGQTILLGCALLRHENAETFEWLFTEWLSCMGGKAPGGFLTDQCAAMRKALAKVMPHSRHRWCLWHILQKFHNKLESYKDYDDMKGDLHNCIYDSITVEEFQRNWGVVMDKYNLHDDEWLQGLYASHVGPDPPKRYLLGRYEDNPEIRENKQFLRWVCEEAHDIV